MIEHHTPGCVAVDQGDVPPGPASSPWLTVAGAAGYATLSRDTIYTACERGELRHVRVGGRRAIRLRSEWIDAWLERYARGCRTDDVAR